MAGLGEDQGAGSPARNAYPELRGESRCLVERGSLSESTGGEPLQHVPKGSRIFFPVRGRPRYRVKQAAPANRPARCFVSRSVRVIHFAPRDKPRVWNVRGSRLLYIPFGLAHERANLRRFYGHVPKRLPSRLALREPRPTNHVSLLTNRVALRSSTARRSATAFSTVLRTRARTSAGARFKSCTPLESNTGVVGSRRGYTLVAFRYLGLVLLATPQSAISGPREVSDNG
jgi:hypothetical protein